MMKKISIILKKTLLSFILVIYSGGSVWGATGSAYITMSIVVRDDTCTISSGASTTLDFGKIVISDFYTSIRKRATINLTCPDSTTKVKATLTGTPSTTNSALFKNMGTASASVRVYQADTYTTLSNGSSWEINVADKTATFKFDITLIPPVNSKDMMTGTIQIPLSIIFSYS